jgi:hypothetical protein
MRTEAQMAKGPQGPKAELRRLEQLIHSELKSLDVGAQPLLDEVREGVSALYPEAGGTRLAPAEHQGRHAKLLKSLDALEDVLEALQLAARSGRPVTRARRGEG